MDTQGRAEAMRRHVEYLASPELGGRAPGTAGGLLARRHVEAALAELGLEPLGDDGGYAHAIAGIEGGGANLLGAIPGRGRYADRFLLVAAHYDHLGSLGGRVYPGADDNASGVAVILDVAGRLTEWDELGRTVVICAFDAEEPPHFYGDTMGSVHWVDRPTIDMGRLDAMVCLDLVGRRTGPDGLEEGVGRSVFVLGAERARIGRLVDGTGNERLLPRRLDADLIPPLSDHYAFERAGIPFLLYTNGRDRNYHTPADTAEKLDYRRMVGLADHLVDLVTVLAEARPFSYHPEEVDDAATLRTLIDLSDLVGDLHPELEPLTASLRQLQQQVEAGTPLTRAHRSRLQWTVLYLEEALA